MRWNYDKARETYYVPLWDAAIKKKDRFSPPLRAEGELLYQRYLSEAEAARDLAEEDSRNLFEEWESFKAGLSEISNACPLSKYRDCIEVWASKIEGLSEKLQKALNALILQERELTQSVAKTADETPSEHSAFGARYREIRGHWIEKYDPEVLSALRGIREELENNWAGDSCCKLCTAENSKEEDPVLQQIKPKSEGSKGVSGRVVNQANISQAIDELDRQKN